MFQNVETLKMSHFCFICQSSPSTTAEFYQNSPCFVNKKGHCLASFSGFNYDRQCLKFRTTSSSTTCQKWKKVWMVVAQYANQGESLVLSMSLKMSWTAIRIMMIIIMSIINDHDLFDSIIDYKRDLSIIKIMNFFRS